VIASGGISDASWEISCIVTTFAASIEEQGRATHAIARNATEAARGTTESSSNISSVMEAAGDTGTEDVRLLLPAGTAAAGLRLRFGLYHPLSGDRLPVGSLQGRAASRFSLTDGATALLAPD